MSFASTSSLRGSRLESAGIRRPIALLRRRGAAALLTRGSRSHAKGRRPGCARHGGRPRRPAGTRGSGGESASSHDLSFPTNINAIGINTPAPGTTALDLNDVILSAPFGVPIALAEVRGASITVIPEPGTALLVLAGLSGLRGARKSR